MADVVRITITVPLRWRDAINEIKRALILRSLVDHGGNVTATAAALGIHRNSVHAVIRQTVERTL